MDRPVHYGPGGVQKLDGNRRRRKLNEGKGVIGCLAKAGSWHKERSGPRPDRLHIRMTKEELPNGKRTTNGKGKKGELKP